MAKTRIKTTPTRMQKEALSASAAVNTSNNSRIITEHVLKKRLCALSNSTANKDAIQQPTIIVQPPKRTNSISSSTSTISHTSDGQSSSSVESPPPPPNSNSSSYNTNSTTNSNGPTMDELTENAIKTLNAGLLAKTNALALKNRKVYMITEKCDDTSLGGHNNCGGGNSSVSSAGGNGNGATGNVKYGGGQKRKMYLIMEEKETEDESLIGIGGQTEKSMKTDGITNGVGTKKLTLFTDTTNGQLPQKIEKILPEILNCIQAKGAATVSAGNGGLNINSGLNVGNGVAATIVSSTTNGLNVKNNQCIGQELNGAKTIANGNGKESYKVTTKDERDNNERLPLTLPPKKNRTKIITTQIIPVNQYHHHNQTTATTDRIVSSNGDLKIAAVASQPNAMGPTANNKANTNCPIRVSGDKSSATPVIVNATTLTTISNGSNSNCRNGNGSLSKVSNNIHSTMPTTPQAHKNINLSTDFLFLMKMLPKLESVAEPHKNYVRACIEDIINQYAPPQTSYGDP